jgi:aspartate/methionine/tyrosine aminotransferase
MASMQGRKRSGAGNRPMHIRPFGVEIWMNATETRCAYNLGETCVESLTMAELLELTGQSNSVMADLLLLKLTYGEIEGSARLRSAICGLYERQHPDNIIVTHGTIGANALLYAALVNAGDRVVSIVPTYQQHVSIPESIGADVQRLQLRAENGFLPDLEELKRLVTPGTTLIALTNPNNPTGALIGQPMLEEIAAIAREAGAYILCDEVYRGTQQDVDNFTPSIADLYEKGIATCGMSKAFSLAGLRLGWIAAPRDVIEAVSIHRDYNTISVGMLDDHFAAIALEHQNAIMARSRRITRQNLAILDAWVAKEPMISWVKPKAGTTALLKLEWPVASHDFCTRLMEKTGVMLVPGSAMDMEGHVRIGFANNGEVLREGLQRLTGFLASEAAALKVPA